MKPQLKSMLLLITVSLIILVGCKKNDSLVSPSAQSAAEYNDDVRGVQALKFNADVPSKWYALAITLARTTPGHAGPVIARTFGYMGLALYESVVPGMPSHQSIQSQ